jgi:hypothetical protein
MQWATGSCNRVANRARIIHLATRPRHCSAHTVDCTIQRDSTWLPADTLVLVFAAKSCVRDSVGLQFLPSNTALPATALNHGMFQRRSGQSYPRM